MRTVTKFLTVFSLVFMSIACQDGTSDMFGNAANKHSDAWHDNARTTTTTYISGTMSLPAGTYDVLEIAPGSNLTLQHGVKFNEFYFTGPGSTVTIPTGATVTNYITTSVGHGCTLTNNGTLDNKQSFFLKQATFNNIGKHYVANDLVLEWGTNYNESLLATIQVSGWLDVREVNAYFSFTGTSSLIMPSATFGYLMFRPAGGSTSGIFLGKGKVITNGGSIGDCPVTGSASIKICSPVPLTYFGTGSLGPGSLGC